MEAALADDMRPTFSALLTNHTLIESLERQGIVTPTPVQSEVIPLLLKGRDVIAQAKTGSGKTLAFALPLLEKLSKASNPNQTHALVLTPTRELATQITEVIRTLNAGIEPVCIIGGVGFDGQLRALEADRRVVVGTPGRILDLIRKRELILRRTEFFVVDEADEMFSMDFEEDVRTILARLPEERQGIFVSATITPRVESLANSFLTKPERIIIKTPGEEMPQIEHLYCEVGSELSAKVNALCDLLETERPSSAIIFCNTKSDTELVEAFLRRRGFDARLINSDLNQRQRERVMAMIKNQELQYLIGTDIASRGIDIEELAVVFNYSLPEQPEQYVHRTGRTGRAGHTGRAISFISPHDFAAFQSLKRDVPAELKPIPLPTDEQIVAARLSHFLEVLRTTHIQPAAREVALAKTLLKQLGGLEDPSEEVTEVVAKLYRFTLEHAIAHEALDLGEEKPERAETSPRESAPHHRRPERRGGGRDRHGGGRDRHGGGRGRDGRRHR